MAREAGVGVGTVSRVLSGGALVAEQTRHRVDAAVERLGFRPMLAARSLRHGRTHTLMLVIPLFTRHFYVELVRGVVEATRATDYSLVIRTIERPQDRDRAFAELRHGGADGALIVSLRIDDDLAHALAVAMPTVLVDSSHPRLPSVGIDHRAAMAAMVRHLIDLGHRRIALIDRPDDSFAPTRTTGRQEGYREAMASAGLPVREGWERVEPWTVDAGAAALEHLLLLPEPPSAIVVGSDTQAFGVLSRAREVARAVPADLAVCGYNDVEAAAFLGLTSTRVPMQTMGALGARRLLALLNGAADKNGHTLLPTELIVRATCGLPRT